MLSFPRAFTVDEANSLLPELRETFAAIEERMTAIRHANDLLSILDVLWGAALSDGGNPDHAEAEAHRLEIVTLMHEVEKLVDENIRSQGIRFPQGGIEQGLVDFPTTLDGRWVFLCWQKDEPEVQAWHELAGGFAGRKPVTAAVAGRMGVTGLPGDDI